MAERAGAPKQSLGMIDVVAIIVGLVIGAGIFKAPAVVAANVGSEEMMMFAWLLGGVVSLAGALCYGELASAYPHTGGEYHYLRRAYGRPISFLFAWSRLVVLQTGSIALLGYVLGDYATALLPLGANSSAIYAALAVAGLTLLNMAGLKHSKRTQNALTLFTVLGMGAVIVAAIAFAPTTALANGAPAAPAGMTPAFGLAMVFVLLTYGGWNEAAYISAEIRGGRRNMAKVLIAGIAVITAIYLLVNFAYLRVLGLAGMAASEVVTADAMRLVLGDGAAQLVSVLILVAVFASINVTVMTGARTNYAMAQDFPLFGFLGRWRAGPNAPINALFVQGAIALLLVFIGAQARSGFEAMVQYVSPIFWLFFLMTGLSLFVLRRREPHRDRPFRVPLYPFTPLLFVATCAYMLYSSLAYTGFGALLGVAVLAAGLPLLFFINHAPVVVPGSSPSAAPRARLHDRQGG